MIAEFNQLSKDLYWTLYDPNDGPIRWTGYDNSYWWDEVSKSKDFRRKKGKVTGRIFILDPETDLVSIEESLQG